MIKQVNVIIRSRDFSEVALKKKTIRGTLVQGNYYRRTRFVTSSNCKTRLVTHSTCFTIRGTRLSTLSTRLSTRSTPLSTLSICLSTRSTRTTICRSFYNRFSH